MNKKDYFIELIMPIIMVIISIWVIVASYSMGSEGVFPRLIAYLLLIGVAVTVGEILIKKQKVVHFENLHVVRVVILLAISFAYIILMDWIGYCLDTFLLCAATMLLLGYRSWWKIGLSSLATVVLVFILFKVILNVPLPLLFLDF